MVVRDVSLCQCAGIGFFIKENNITVAFIDHLCHESRGKKPVSSSIRHCDGNMGITGPPHCSCIKPTTVMCDKHCVNVLIKDDGRVLVNKIVAQLVIGHSAVQDIRKFVSVEFLDHCSSIVTLAHCWRKWEICGRVMEHSSDGGYQLF